VYDDNGWRPGKSPYFLCGLYYIQEPAAMMTAESLPIDPSDIVLDMCAAPGGKSCRTASRLSDNGLLIANDIDPLRAKILSGNVERFGLTNTIVTNVDPAKFPERFNGCFDKIMLDAPCSGEGMLRSKALAEATWSPEKVDQCAAIQTRLIDTAVRLLKPGGLLMYATCTYETKENEDIIRYALSHHDLSPMPLEHHEGMDAGIDMPEAVRLYPHRFIGEGQFYCLLQKNSGTEGTLKTAQPVIAKKETRLVQDFYKSALNVRMPQRLHVNKNHVYAWPNVSPDTKGLKVLRNGLYVGELKKNRFEPSYALALSLGGEDAGLSYDFAEDDEALVQYIAGEALEARGGRGYGLITCDGLPLSFFKESNMIKNLFPKGLRRR